jgi:hypothetical protein
MPSFHTSFSFFLGWQNELEFSVRLAKRKRRKSAAVQSAFGLRRFSAAFVFLVRPAF